ncbi:MAG: PilZ domain-containing protein [Sedimentibacter sp.]|uniref:PilZ domain-containing protein n=1 Tax=Sedimentibacter sp. TaxID=1960295 RepID=UPI002982904E|nr:PilZ domain-containing protein [Sedimentibacter sp.]MDW5300025.1 PilZ domain-containing protein [Sedimentibacter sp.]
MDKLVNLVKIYDNNKNLLGIGQLLNINSATIKIKGDNLPIINSETEVYIEIYDELVGISPYLCKIGVAAKNQLNAHIINKEAIIERRNSLKVRTDLSFYIESLERNDEDITKEVPNMKINMLNLCIGGMLISSNYDLLIDDKITFYFKYAKFQMILIHAKVIRIDIKKDNDNDEIETVNYGCSFSKMARYNESVIIQYLYDRQLQLYRNR